MEGVVENTTLTSPNSPPLPTEIAATTTTTTTTTTTLPAPASTTTTLPEHSDSKLSPKKQPSVEKKESHDPTRKGKEFVLSVLSDGKIPSLPDGCAHHFFISKDETFKNDSVHIANWLIELGFSVWESQLEKEQGRSVTPEAMQLGIQNAAVVILLLTPGVFHSERHFVWNTEIKHALEECHKPLMVIKVNGFRSAKCSSTFATNVDMHHVECCNDTHQDFQPFSRAILKVPTRVTWKLTGVDSKRAIMREFRNIMIEVMLRIQLFVRKLIVKRHFTLNTVLVLAILVN